MTIKGVLANGFCFALSVAIIAIGPAGLLAAAESNKPLAKVGSDTITESDMAVLMNAVPQRFRNLYQSDEAKKQTLDYIVNVHVLAKEAQNQGMDRSDSFRRLMDFTKKDLLARLYLEQQAKGLPLPTEQEAKAYYDANIDQYKVPETIHLRHILVKTEKEADDALKKLKKGAKFEDLASKGSVCPSRVDGGDLDWLPRGRLVKEVEDAAFAMKPNEIAGPVKSRYGYHVLLVEGKRPARQRDFADIKAFIIEELKTKKKQEAYEKLASDLKKKMNVQILLEESAPQAKPGAAAMPPASSKAPSGPAR